MHPGLLRVLDDSAVFIKGRHGPPRAATRAQEGFEPEKKKVDGLAVRKPSVTNVRELPPQPGYVSNSCGVRGVHSNHSDCLHTNGYEQDRHAHPDWVPSRDSSRTPDLAHRGVQLVSTVQEEADRMKTRNTVGSESAERPMLRCAHSIHAS